MERALATLRKMAVESYFTDSKPFITLLRRGREPLSINPVWVLFADDAKLLEFLRR